MALGDPDLYTVFPLYVKVRDSFGILCGIWKLVKSWWRPSSVDRTLYLLIASKSL